MREATLPAAARGALLRFAAAVSRALAQRGLPHWLAQHSLAHVSYCGELPPWSAEVAFAVHDPEGALPGLQQPLTAAGFHCAPTEGGLCAALQAAEGPRLECRLEWAQEAVPVAPVAVDDPGVRAEHPRFAAVELPAPVAPPAAPERITIAGRAVLRGFARDQARAADALARIAAKTAFAVDAFVRAHAPERDALN